MFLTYKSVSRLKSAEPGKKVDPLLTKHEENNQKKNNNNHKENNNNHMEKYM